MPQMATDIIAAHTIRYSSFMTQIQRRVRVRVRDRKVHVVIGRVHAV